MILLTLIAKMIACAGILYAYYWFFLRNKRFHHYNRFYLLAVTGVSIIIPFIKIPIFFEPNTAGGQIVYKSIDIISVNRWEDEFVENATSNSLSSWVTAQTSLLVLYGIGVIILLYVLGRSLIYIHNLSKKYSYEYINALKLYNTNEPGTPFSFFRSIFWNSRLDFNSKEGQQIFMHEIFHVKQRHSVDILFLECVCIFLWFNPFFYLIKKEIKAIHEFLADEHSVSDNNQHDYAELLILQSIKAKKTTISNYFFQNHIKRRIAMITEIKTKKYNYWTRLMVLPLSILLFCAVALYARSPNLSNIKKEQFQTIPQALQKSLTVLVDAGHGGEDFGAKSDNGLLEKDFTLAIARQIKQHAPAYNIKIIMTRDEDIYPAIKERAEMATTIKADMVIAVHVAAAAKVRTDAGYSPNPASGFDIFVTNKNQKTVGQSKILGQEIAKQVSSFYTISAIKQRKENGIWILDAVPCPAVLIECGYLTNEKDVAFISKIENQEKIAKSILQGITEYHSGNINKNLGDTIPVKKPIKDNEALIKQEITHRKLAEAQALLLEQKTILQKQHDIEIVQRKIAENSYLEIQHQQKALIQKQQESELVRQKIAENRDLEIVYEQRALIQKQQETGLTQRKIAENRYLEIQHEQKVLIQKEDELDLAQRKIAENRYREIQHEQRALIQKQQEMELAQHKLDRAYIIQDSLLKDRPDPVFTKVEIEASYPGGSPAWQRYLIQNLRYPIKAVQQNISGTVIVEFVVDKKGKLSDINVMTGPDELRAEAIRIIRQSGKWTPAQQNGQTVKAYRRQSITFKLEK